MPYFRIQANYFLNDDLLRIEANYFLNNNLLALSILVDQLLSLNLNHLLQTQPSSPP